MNNEAPLHKQEVSSKLACHLALARVLLHSAHDHDHDHQPRMDNMSSQWSQSQAADFDDLNDEYYQYQSRQRMEYSANARLSQDTNWKPKAQVERLYRAQPAPDRMEASLHYLRGRTDALLMQLKNGGNVQRPPLSAPMSTNDTYLLANFMYEIGASSRTSRVGPIQHNLEASIQSLRANKASLNQLNEEMNNLKSTFRDIRELDVAPYSRGLQAVVTSTRFHGPNQPLRPPETHRMDYGMDRRTAYSDYRTNLPYDAALPPDPYAPSRVPRSAAAPRTAQVAAMPVPVPVPMPSTYMRYLRNARQDALHKDNAEELASARLRSREAAKYDAKLDYQPQRRPVNYDFRPIAAENAGFEKADYDDPRITKAVGVTRNVDLRI